MEVKDCNNLKEQSTTGLSDVAQKRERFKSLELLKKKMCRSHDLIQSYNDKFKECEQLKISLRKVRAEANEMKTNYNNTLSKLIKLELQNNDHRKLLETSAKTIVDYEAKVAGDQRLIQQLTCKIEDNDEKNADKLMDADLNKLKLEEKIKSLEQEIKNLKKSRITDRKKLKDTSVNTDEVHFVDSVNLDAEAKMLEDRLLSNDFNKNTDPAEENSSILCTKCNVAFEKLLSSFEPPELMIEPLLSAKPHFDPNLKENYTEPLHNPVESREVVEPEHLTDPLKEKHLDSETIKVLKKRLKILERKIKKNEKTEVKSRCCHSNSCFPNPANQDLMLKIWKKLLDKDGPSQNRHCKKKLKRSKSKRKAIYKKKGKIKAMEEWSIESTNDTSRNKSIEPSVSQNQSLIIRKRSDHLPTENVGNEIPSDKVNVLSKKNPKEEFKSLNRSLIIRKKSDNFPPEELGNRIPNSDKVNTLSKEKNSEEESKSSNQSLIRKKSNNLDNRILNSLAKVNILSEEKNSETKTSNEASLKIGRVKMGFSIQVEENSLESEGKKLVPISDEGNESISVPDEPEESISIIEESISVSEESISVPEESISVPEESISIPKDPILVTEKSKADESRKGAEDFEVTELFNDKESLARAVNNIETVSIKKQTTAQSLKRKEAPTDKIFKDSIDSVLTSCNTSDEDKTTVGFASVSGQPCKKMVCKRLISYYPNAPLPVNSRRNSSDLQSLQSENVQNLVINSESENKEASPENLEKEKEDLKRNKEDLGKKIEDLEKDSINSNEIQTQTQENKVKILEENNSFSNPKDKEEGEISLPSMPPSFKNNGDVESHEETSQEGLQNSKSIDLLEELSLSEDESVEEREVNESIFSISEELSHSKKQDASDIFISNSDKTKVSKNFIHGKRSSELLLTVISPKNPQTRKKKVEVIKNFKRRCRGNLLSKIRTLKRRSTKVLSTTVVRKSEERKDSLIDVPRSGFDDSGASSSFVPPKKRRIAHIPRTENEIEIINSFDDSPPIEVPIRKSLRSASKSPAEVKSFKERVQSSDEKTKNSLPVNLTEKEENASGLKKPEPPVVRKKGRPRKQVKQEIALKEDLSGVNLREKNIGNVNLQKENVSTVNLQQENLTNVNLQKKNLLGEKSKSAKKSISLVDLSKEKEEIVDENSSKVKKDLESPLSPGVSLNKSHNVILMQESPKNSENVIDPGNYSISKIKASSDEDIALASRITMKNDYWKTAMTALNESKETRTNSEGSFRELRSRQVEVATMSTPEFVKTKVKYNFLPLHPRNPILKTHYVIKLLNESFSNKFENSIQTSKPSQTSLEKNVRSQLLRLVESESWTSELHSDVVEKISEMCQTTTAAKCIVDFLCKKFLEEEPLDKSNTPPAPMMTRTQQKIVTLIFGLEPFMPEIVNLITTGINFSLFRLGYAPDRCVIEGLARIYTVLARLKKDREKARLLCSDALYCYRLNAIIVIYVVLTCWPEVFPICDTNPEILPKCMAHIILTAEGSGPKYPKVAALKNLLSAYYQYPKAEYFSKNLVAEFLSALKEKHESSTDMAIMLLAKKEGPDWTYKNIIQGGLLQMIVEKVHPSVYDAFSLLSNLMRSFPAEDKQGHISKTVQQLCDLLDSNQGTEDHLEGVATALLSLSKFGNSFTKVAKSLLLWKPKQDLRAETLTKFKYFFQSHPRGWWRTFIMNDYMMPSPETKKKNHPTKMPQLNKMRVQKKKTKKARAKKADTSEEKVPSSSQ